MIELGVDGRPRLIERTQGHLCTFLAGGDPLWLRDELTEEQQALADEIDIEQYLPDQEVRDYLLNLVGSTLFGTSAGMTKMGVILTGGEDQGKTSLVNLLMSAAGEYGGEGRARYVQQYDWRNFRRVSLECRMRLTSDSLDRIDELPTPNKFDWGKYKVQTSGFKIKRPSSGNASSNLTEWTPMPLIACNLGQLPYKPEEGALDKVCLITPSLLGLLYKKSKGRGLGAKDRKRRLRWTDAPHTLEVTARLRRCERRKVRLRKAHARKAEGS